MLPPPKESADKNRALFAAAIRGDAAAVTELLAQGADPNTRGTRFAGATAMTVLCAAAEAGQADCVRLLAEAGAKLEEGTVDGRRPLVCAVRDGHLAVAKLLVGRGARLDVSYGPDTLLDLAENCPHPLPMARLLFGALDKAAQQRAFLRAARRGMVHTIAAGAGTKGFDIDCRDDLANTALILAAQGAPRNGAEIVRLLLARGAAVDAVNDMQETALCAAMVRQPVCFGTAQALVEAGADIGRENLAGMTNYEAAQHAGNEKILPFFEAAHRQQILREMKKQTEEAGSRLRLGGRRRPSPGPGNNG
jgi:ankyrin repeat protein